MKQKGKSSGSLRERWTERLAGPASAEEMRMWPLMLRTLALNLRAGIPLQEAVHTNPGSGQLGENLEPDTGKTPAKKAAAWKTRVKNSSRKSTRPRRARGLSPLSEEYGHKRCAASRRRSPRLPPGVSPHISPARSYLKTVPGCARTAASACTTCS